MEIELTLGQFMLAVVLFLLILVLFIVLIRKLVKKLRKPDLVGYSQDQIKSAWEEVEKMARQGTVLSYKLAVIEADKLLDHVLKAMGFPGDDMGQRLKVATFRYEGVRKAWFGHKVRNQLVHESSFHLTPNQAQDAIKSFKRALQELNVL